MAHLEIAVVAPPDGHEDILREINEWRYEVEGPLLKGHVRPFVSEIKFYDVRIPKEAEARFVRDFEIRSEAWGLGLEKHKQTHDKKMMRHGFGLYHWAMKFIRRFTPFKASVPADGPKQYTAKGWHYAILLGRIEDDQCEVSLTGNKREVL